MQDQQIKPERLFGRDYALRGLTLGKRVRLYRNGMELWPYWKGEPCKEDIKIAFILKPKKHAEKAI